MHGLSVRAAAAAEWDTAWDQSQTATFFESRLWAELWFAYSAGRYEPEPKVVSLADRWKVVVPLSRQRTVHGLAPTNLLTPGGNYGGWLELEGKVGAEDVGLLVNWLTTRHKSLSWRANPYDAVTLAAFPASARSDSTETIPLGGEIESVARGFSHSHSGAVRKASRLGVTVRNGYTPADWRSYYGIYCASLTRWGPRATTRYGWRLFELLAGLPRDVVRLWIASLDGRDLAGIVCVCSKRRVVAWQGPAMREAFPNRAVQATVHRAIVDAIACGADWFDMNPSGGLEGVRQFKQGFGTTTLPCPVYDQHKDLRAVLPLVKRQVEPLLRRHAAKETASPQEER